MIIKSSKFSDCSSCALLEAKSCICETNCKKNLRDVELLVVAENPGKQEIEQEKPLVGPAGKIFRQYFQKYSLQNFKYLITNTVLCATIRDGKTTNPDDETIDRCKYNLFEMIKLCNPKIILSLGSTPMKAFGIAKSGITSLRGKVYKWNGYDVFVSYHPSFVRRNMYNKDSRIIDNFDYDFRACKNILTGLEDKSTEGNVKTVGKGIFYYKIPQKFYSDKYRLIDIQNIHSEKKILYIFRDINNKKIYYETNENYVCYTLRNRLVDNTMITSYSNLEQIQCNDHRSRNNLNSNYIYEGDLKLIDKHSIDYYLQSKDEPENYDLNIMYLDIELDLHGNKDIPDATNPEHPVNLITTCYHNNIITYVLKNVNHDKIDYNYLRKNLRDSFNFKIFEFDSEEDMFRKFTKDFHQQDPDILTGWYVIRFDTQYIVNRMKKICPELNLSRYDESYVEDKYDYAHIPGIVVVDMLKVYKEFSQNKQENYKLGTIAQNEIGYTKIFLEESMDNMYQNNLNKFVEYNIRDVTLLVDLEKKLGYLSFLDEVRKTCNTTFKSVSSTIGRLDTLIVSKLKSKGLASRNKIDQQSKTFAGAYVKEPLKGLHSYIVDLDFTSLYPSIIITYNIGPNTFFCKFKKYEQGYDFIYDFDALPEDIDIIFDPLYKKKEVRINKNKFKELVDKSNLVYTINGCFYKNHKTEISVFSDILDELMSSRKIMNQKLSEAIEKKQPTQVYENKQWAYKILANAMYGILGTPIFRFFNVDLATSITLSGQEAIKTSMIYANKYVDDMYIKSNKHLVKDHSGVVLAPLSKSEMFGEVDNHDLSYIITDDTDSLFLTFEKFFVGKHSEQIIQKVIDMATEVQDYLNNDILITMVKKHKVSKDNTRLNLKNELVIKRGLYVSKKHYANYVVYKKGKIVDKITTTGLETKRSDYSKFTKENLTKLLELILKDNATIGQILSFVKRKKNELKKLLQNGARTCCKPVSFVKNLKSYKVIPEGVRGMLNWNNIEYESFVPGSKGYLVKIFGVDLDKAPRKVVDNYQKHFSSSNKKLDIIVFPDEVPVLPSYYIIDTKKMIKFHWEDRCNLLLENVVQRQEDTFTI